MTPVVNTNEQTNNLQSQINSILNQLELVKTERLKDEAARNKLKEDTLQLNTNLVSQFNTNLASQNNTNIGLQKVDANLISQFNTNIASQNNTNLALQKENTNLASQFNNNLASQNNTNIALQKENTNLASQFNNNLAFQKENNNTITSRLNALDEKIALSKKQETIFQSQLNELNKLKDQQSISSNDIKLNKQQLDMLSTKLVLIDKLFNEFKTQHKAEHDAIDNDICKKYTSMPLPKPQDFMNNNKKDLPYSWCLCNDNISKNIDCLEYKNCLDFYSVNKEKKSLESDELNLYYGCLNRFNSFPSFIVENFK